MESAKQSPAAHRRMTSSQRKYWHKEARKEQAVACHKGLQPTNASPSRYAMNCYSQSAANKTPTILTGLSEATSVPSMHRNFPVLLRRQLSAGECHRAERHGYPHKHKARWNRTRTIPLTRARKKAASIHRCRRHSHLEKARQ